LRTTCCVKLAFDYKNGRRAADEEGADNNGDWDEIGDKVEKKLKRKIREWAEKE